MNQKPSAVQLAAAAWTKSSYSGSGGNECVEIARVAAWSCVRDSKTVGGPALVLDPSALGAFVDAVRGGSL